MANPLLPITTNSQSQTTTQSPQSGVQSIDSGSKASSVQPGTTTDLLNGSGGVSLHPTTLPSVGLNSAPSTVAPPTATAQPAKHPHHVNPALFGFSVLLFLVAAVLVWATARSAKRSHV